MMKNANPVVWFEIYVDDLNRSKNFYEAVFQLEFNELPMPGSGEADIKMLFFPSDEKGVGASGALVKMEGVKAGGNSSLIYFRSEDCAIEEKRIKKAGGKIFKSKQSLGEFGFMLLAYDTEGNMFGIHSMA